MASRHISLSIDEQTYEDSIVLVGRLIAEGIKDAKGRKMSLSGLIDLLLRDTMGEK